MVTGSDAGAAWFSPWRVIFDSFRSKTRPKHRAVGLGRCYHVAMDAAGARVLAERISKARPLESAPAPAEQGRAARFGGFRRKRPQARIAAWIDVNRAADVPSGPSVWIGEAPSPEPVERWFFYERTRDVVVDGRPTRVVETVCTKVRAAGRETTVVARRDLFA
jgi:hypothetical protein